MNDGANRADAGNKSGSAVAPYPSRREEEELETGEPLPEEEDSRPAKKIAALRGKFDGKAGPAKSEPEENNSGGGQMVLASAKYLTPDEYNTDTPENRKKLAQRRKAEETRENGGASLEGRIFNGGFWGGLLAMVVAVLWFVIGLMDDIIFFYPPILFVIGLGAMFKGGSKGEGE